jgi:hypothetical protein
MMMRNDDELFEDFLAFSAVLTGFSPYRLRGTGQVKPFWSTLNDIAGTAIARELLSAFRSVADEAGADEAALERSLRLRILSDAKLGPLARNLIKLWYVGTWYELPREWRETYGGSENDRTFVVSASAYVEGLLWPAIGANPSGAKPLGYGTWADPPAIES